MSRKSYVTKNKLIKAINDICKKDCIIFRRQVGIGTTFNGNRMVTNYVCGVEKNFYIQHYTSWANIEYNLIHLDKLALLKIYNKLLKTINEN